MSKRVKQKCAQGNRQTDQADLVCYKKKVYGVTKVQLHVFLTMILHGISGQLQAAAALTRHVLNRRLGAPRSQSGRFGKQKNVSHPYKKSNHDSSDVQLVAWSTYRLSYSGDFDDLLHLG